MEMLKVNREVNDDKGCYVNLSQHSLINLILYSGKFMNTMHITNEHMLIAYCGKSFGKMQIVLL